MRLRFREVERIAIGSTMTKENMFTLLLRETDGTFCSYLVERSPRENEDYVPVMPSEESTESISKLANSKHLSQNGPCTYPRTSRGPGATAYAGSGPSCSARA